MEYVELLVYQYLPKHLIPENFMEMDFDDFFYLAAKASCARKMRVEDIQSGVMQAAEKLFSSE